MNYKNYFLLHFILGFALFFTIPDKVFSQLLTKQAHAVSGEEAFEDTYIHWFFALDKVRIGKGVSRADFDVFTRFSQKQMDSLRADFMKRIGSGQVNTSNVGKYEPVLENALDNLYGKYEIIKKLYPSSVNEYRDNKPVFSSSCDSACDNIDFESGNLSGWNAYYAFNNSSTTSNNIIYITGGPAGAVTHAANDTLTSTPGFYNSAAGVPPNPRPDYQVNITSGSRGDAIIPSVPVVSPFGGKYSVMLGDSTQVNYGVAILSQTFLVGSSNTNFTYQYAVFLANPMHNYYQQPFFRIAVLDQDGDTIPYCGEYNVVSGNGTQKFDSIYYYFPTLGESFWVYYKNWTIVNVPLLHYVGQCVTVVFEAVDCALGGHFGYAYIDASCSPMAVLASSQNFCGQDSITLTGPSGESQYSWAGPAGGIISNDTLSRVSIDSAGTYTLIVTPFTGATCADTLTTTIGKKAGPLPHPDFSASTGCAGLPTAFSNLSSLLSGASFYWDFYNSGAYEDSLINPEWTYNLPGTYSVKLQEIYNGCGMDTTINVVIDTTVSSSFSADTVCFRDTTQFINTSIGGVAYYWNFGDAPSGSNDASQNINPLHTFSAPGTYTVTLIGIHPGWCNDTAKGNVVVLALPKPGISGTDSLCLGSSAILTAVGGSSYLWNTGATTSSISVTPAGVTTYNVKVTNNGCSADTGITIFIKPVLNGTLTGSGEVCLNDTIHLTATGGGTYLWSTGATTGSIGVVANSENDTAYSVTITNGKSCVTINKTIIVNPLPVVGACCDTTIVAGTSVVIHDSGGTSYYWNPPNAISCTTCPNPTVSPTVTTTYTVITIDSDGCSVTLAITIGVDIICKDFTVPDVFTPNGDGKNDTYLVPAEFMSKYEISIYNRWGQQVFTSGNPANPWDGKIDGSPASPGVYYYIIQATCLDGTYFEKHGFLQLIR